MLMLSECPTKYQINSLYTYSVYMFLALFFDKSIFQIQFCLDASGTVSFLVLWPMAKQRLFPIFLPFFYGNFYPHLSHGGEQIVYLQDLTHHGQAAR